MFSAVKDFDNTIKYERRKSMGPWLKGKKAIVIGERDGVQGPAIANCLKAGGAEVIYSTTECFV